jgi:hypothetical protein
MRRTARTIITFTLFCTAAITTAQKAGISFDNQVSSWLSFNLGDTVNWQGGLRYIPVINTYWQVSSTAKLDAEVAFKTFGNLSFSGVNYDSASFSFKPYRLWLRYTSSNLEIRAGLQKINFGSALIFRPLMWFDKMDFRDPLQLTDGVYALLGRYYFNNNVNIWLWGLYGNENVKGWEIAPSISNIPEYGGRFQLPVPRGEMAISYHHRDADYSSLLAGMPTGTETRFTEQLFGIDGKWDLGIGLWIEYVRKLNEKDNPIMGRWETYFSLGADYTLSLGNGLNITSEYSRYANIPDEGEQETKRNLITLSLNYPLSVTHNLSGVVYYNIDAKEWYRFINFQLSYDYLGIYLMAYWNPDDPSVYNSSAESTLYPGKGFQLMLVLDI